MKNTIIVLLSFILLISCESKAQENKNNFCINTNKTKTLKECEECLYILDIMLSKDEIKKQDYIIKKLNYFLLLKKYDEALFFLDKETFAYYQEKEIRKKEILLVKNFCSKDLDTFKESKNNLVSFIESEMLKTGDGKLIQMLKNEKSAIESNLIVDYYCSESEKKEGASVISQ